MLKRQFLTVIVSVWLSNGLTPWSARYHWGFKDPAHATGTPEEIRDEFRRVRDEIRRVFEAYAAGLKEAAARAK